MGNEKIIKMKCESCGSKDLIIASDDVQIARIKAETEKAKIESKERDNKNTYIFFIVYFAILAIVSISLVIFD